MKKILFSLMLSMLPFFGFGQIFAESFDDVSVLDTNGWIRSNQSTTPGLAGWGQGAAATFPAYQGGYVVANYTANTGNGTISNWLITPVINVKDGDKVSFWTRTASNPATYPDRLEFRMSLGATHTAPSGPTGVGSFTTLMQSVNPDLTSTGYPAVWTKYEMTVSGVGATAAPVKFAFRYFVTGGGTTGANSNIIGVDEFQVEAGAAPVNDCDQGDDSNGFENGYQIGVGTNFKNADDFMVSAGNTLNVKTIELNVITTAGPIVSIDFTFYNNDGGKPGSVAQTVTGLVPYSQNVVGSAFGYDVRTVYVDVDLNFAGGANGTTYWMQPTATAPGGVVGGNFWEVSTAGSLGSPIHTSELNGPWEPDEDGAQGVFKLHCDHVTVPPPPPCSPNVGTSDIEPITRFVFAGIDNPSDATVNGSPAIEDFTSISGDVDLEGTYPVALEGNTGGNYTNYFTVFIDWNQDGFFDGADEMYPIGSIVNSTGLDGKQATGNITVPATALVGTTKIRIIKNFNSSPTNPCGTYSYGQAEEYSLNVHGSTTPGADCDQGDDSNGFENGYQIGVGTDFENADDFMVSAGNTLNVKSIEMNVITTAGPIEEIAFTFYEDDGGKPGSVAQTVTGLVPYSQNVVGSAFGYDVRTVFVDVDLNFAGGTSGKTYWMQPTATAPGGTIGGNFWEISTAGSLGSPIHTSELGGPWTADEDGAQAVFKLHCDHVTPPPPVPCTPTMGTFDVEPITRFVFAGIDNQSDATVNGSPGLEDFTSISGNVMQGTTYPVAIEGNTGGNYTNYFTVFIDWNQDGFFDGADEMYEIGSITNSTGTDGQQATGDIAVPATALTGTTVIRVLKNFNSSPTNPCGSYSFGQAEEYSLDVATLAVSDVSKQTAQVYPNPVHDVLNIKSAEKVKSVAVFSAAGNMVGTYQLNADNQINLSKLATGVYLVKITTETGTSTVKVIKK